MNFTNLEKFMDRLTNWRIPGNAISVYKDGKEIHRYASGYSDIEKKIPFSGDDLIYIYSCSKVTTVSAMMQLIERGIVLPSDPVCDYIEEFKETYVRGENGEIKKAETTMTIRHLMTMTAGLDYNLDSDEIKAALRDTNGKADAKTIAKYIAKRPLLFEPGTFWNYSLCHDVLAGVIEAVTGTRFSEYVKKNIFEPLGMEKAYYHATPEIKKQLNPKYIYKVDNGNSSDIVAMQMKTPDGKGRIEDTGKGNSHILGDNYDSGGAGIITTVNEYAKLAGALANGGVGATGERILSPGAINLLRANQLDERAMSTMTWSNLAGYGYGLGVRTLIDIAKSGSCGSIGEFVWGGAAGATVLVDPDKNIAFFYSHHMLNPQEAYYQPRLRNAFYSCF